MIIAQVKARLTFRRPKAARKYLSLWRALVWSRDSERFVGIFRLVYCMVKGGRSSTRLGRSMMHLEFLRKHIDALLALSHDVRDPAVSAKLRELADECRIILSSADIVDLVERLKENARDVHIIPLPQID
jgi:hypothetical protein